MKTIREILEQLQARILTLEFCEGATVCTYEDLLIRITDQANKNQYLHVFVLYDLRQATIREWSTELPLTLVIADKLRANQDNKIHAHSNAFSLAVELSKLLRTWAKEEGYDGINDVPVDIWTEDEGDGLLAGAKMEITIITEIGGYCDIVEAP